MPRPVAWPNVAGLWEAFRLLLVLGLQRVSTVVDGEMIQSILGVFALLMPNPGLKRGAPTGQTFDTSSPRRHDQLWLGF